MQESEQPNYLLSIIIPAYNYGHTIIRCINSVLKQITTDCEIIVIDDGSTDDTPTIIESLINTNQIRYYRQTNQGLATTRNNSVKNAQGQYLLFLDADDELAENAISIILKNIQTNPGIDFFIGGHTAIHPDQRQKLITNASIPENKLTRFKHYLNKKINMCNGAIVINQKVFAKLTYPDKIRLAEDIPFNAHLLALFECTLIPEPLAKIHKHDDSLRHQVKLALGNEELLINTLFNPDILPQAFFKYKNMFQAKYFLSLFRNLYLNKNYALAKNYYKKAIKIYPLFIIRLSYFRKYLKLLVKKPNNG